MINNKKMILVCSCTLSMALITGCFKNDSMVIEESNISTIELLNQVNDKNVNKYKNIVKNFNLGNVTLEDGDKKIDIDLKGIIGVPREIEDAPIIFIISGNNNSLYISDGININSEENKYSDSYSGFKYLVEKLSSNGFLTVAISTDIQIDDNSLVEDKILGLVFEEHLNNLKRAINGKHNNYPVSLYKKGDLNSIGLIGQNNTGRTIFNISNQQLSKNNSSIKGLLSIAPSVGTSVSSYPDIPTSILSTEHSLDTRIAFDVYSDIEKSNGRKSVLGLTYLIGGDSDKFNDLVKEGTLNKDYEESKLAKASLKPNEDTITDELSHEEFLASYTLDFFEYVFGDNLKESIYRSDFPSVQKLYEKEILSKLYNGSKKIILDNNIVDNLILDKIKSKSVIESSVTTLDTAINFNEPTTNIELKLFELDWREENASLSIPIDSSTTLLSDYSCISIEWALNHASELNKEDITSVSVSLKDSLGNISEVVLLDELPLQKISGEATVSIEDNKSTSNWSRFTPIAETRIPIELFENINLEDITSLSINFNENEIGSIYLKNVHLKK